MSSDWLCQQTLMCAYDVSWHIQCYWWNSSRYFKNGSETMQKLSLPTFGSNLHFLFHKQLCLQIYKRGCFPSFLSSAIYLLFYLQLSPRKSFKTWNLGDRCSAFCLLTPGTWALWTPDLLLMNNHKYGNGDVSWIRDKGCPNRTLYHQLGILSWLLLLTILLPHGDTGKWKKHINHCG